jgi:isopentenyl phosphate kinase
MLIFLKLGGSLITDKDKPYTVRIDVLRRAANEIKEALRENTSLKIILGHGSGSFGHFAAADSGFKEGISSPNQWQAFQKVWSAAHELNQILIEEFNKSGLPVISFPPSASITSVNKQIVAWNSEPIATALKNNLIPVVFGDTVFDRNLGGIILSTEELFIHLIKVLGPDSILLAGKEQGVWRDYPKNDQLLSSISPGNFDQINSRIFGSDSTDVTGGMRKKVSIMLEAIKYAPDLKIEIFSGDVPGNIYRALSGMKMGTSILKK